MPGFGQDFSFLVPLLGLNVKEYQSLFSVLYPATEFLRICQFVNSIKETREPMNTSFTHDHFPICWNFSWPFSQVHMYILLNYETCQWSVCFSNCGSIITESYSTTSGIPIRRRCPMILPGDWVDISEPDFYSITWDYINAQQLNNDILNFVVLKPMLGRDEITLANKIDQ